MPALPVPESSPFALAHEELGALGFVVIPITPPDADVRGAGKSPGNRRGGRWENMLGWNQFISRAPTVFEKNAWLSWSGAGIGAVMGTPVRDGLKVVGIDIDVVDADKLADIVSACPPQLAAKTGGKGVTIFCLAGPEIGSRQYRDPSGAVMLDLLAAGKQTVLPPSQHVSGVSYRWVAGPCPLNELPILDADGLAKLEETLQALGWTAEPQREAPRAQAYNPDDGVSYWRETNEAALANLAAWAPALNLHGLRPARGGYEAVASFRESLSGTPLEKRERNLSLVPAGIKDFASGRGHTAIDLVCLAQGISPAEATEWLRQRLGLVEESVWQPDAMPVVGAPPPRLEAPVEASSTAPGAVLPPVGVDVPAPVGPSQRPSTIVAEPFVWRDPRSLPPRDWLYGHHLIRGYVSLTVAPGGVGKSTLTITEALAMASGRDLLGVKVREPLRVWLFNGEDPLEEIQRRVVAAMIHHGIRPADIGNRLFINSGRDTDLMVAVEDGKGMTICMPVIDRLEQEIREKQIDVLVLDPFVSTHGVSENDNTKIDRVVKTFAGIADRAGAAIELVHHSRKTQGGETTVEDSRGASAVLAAVRSARTLNRMSQSEAERLNIPPEDAVRLFRADDGKANLAPMGAATWFRMASVCLDNGTPSHPADWVGVVEPYSIPTPMGGFSVHDTLRVQQALSEAGGARESRKAKDWAGHIVGETLGIDTEQKAGRSRVAAMIVQWLKSGVLAVEQRRDQNRIMRDFLIVGEWVNTECISSE
jgi:hypothetical protein